MAGMSRKRIHDDYSDDDRTPESSEDELEIRRKNVDEDSDDSDYDDQDYDIESWDRNKNYESVSRDDITVTDVCAREDTGGVYFRRWNLPDEIDPFLHKMPPHMFKTLRGEYIGDIVYNLRRAVDKADEDSTSLCLLALFDLFVSINRPIRILMEDDGCRHLRLAACQAFGPFCNLNALAMHQYIWDVVRMVYFEQVGIGTPTAVLELNRLWERYELYLFCDPYTSLASLLSIGKLFCRCYKDGSVVYAESCWADNANDRAWREVIKEDPMKLAIAVPDHCDFIRCMEKISAPVRYYTHRTRRGEYESSFLNLMEAIYMLQVIMARLCT
jgi:hypothetical protein